MNDYISRQNVMDTLGDQLDYLFLLDKKDNPAAENEWYGVNWARNTIKELPTADVIAVVRCENCEYYRNMVCQNPNGLPRYLDGNEFCSYGEKKKK